MQDPQRQRHLMEQTTYDTEIQIRLRRIENAQPTRTSPEQREQQEEKNEEIDQRPRLRRTRIPPTRVLERRERQRALNERIRDTYFDRINGNFLPMEQIEE